MYRITSPRWWTTLRQRVFSIKGRRSSADNGSPDTGGTLHFPGHFHTGNVAGGHHHGGGHFGGGHCGGQHGGHVGGHSC